MLGIYSGELLGSLKGIRLNRESCSGVARELSQVWSGVDLESLAGGLLKAIAAEFIQARKLLGSCSGELLGRIARELCLGATHGSAAGVELGLLGS